MDDFSEGPGSPPSGGRRGSCASDEGRRLLRRRYGFGYRARATLAELRNKLGSSRTCWRELPREAECTLNAGCYGWLRAGTFASIAAVQQKGGAAWASTWAPSEPY